MRYLDQFFRCIGLVSGSEVFLLDLVLVSESMDSVFLIKADQDQHCNDTIKTGKNPVPVVLCSVSETQSDT